jgi:hypothetical protein
MTAANTQAEEHEGENKHVEAPGAVTRVQSEDQEEAHKEERCGYRVDDLSA